MTSEANKIITWAAAESNGHGAHISALTTAIESGRVSSSVVTELKAKRSEWVSEHNSRFFKAA